MRSIRRTSAIIAAGLWLSACGDFVKVEYATGSDARASGIIHRGWLPDWLPDDAREIQLVYDLDTNAIAFSAILPPDGWSLQESAKCVATTTARASRLLGATREVSDTAGTSEVYKCGDYYTVQDDEIFWGWN